MNKYIKYIVEMICILIELIILLIILVSANKLKLSTECRLDKLESEITTTQYSDYDCCDIIQDSIKQIEIDYLAKCVMAKAGNQDDYGKRLVIDVILNRIDCKDFPNNIIEVINEPNQFEVVQNGTIESIAPTDDIYTLIEEELENRTNEEVLYFRTNHYHSFGTPVLVHQAHYFSK